MARSNNRRPETIPQMPNIEDLFDESSAAQRVWDFEYKPPSDDTPTPPPQVDPRKRPEEAYDPDQDIVDVEVLSPSQERRYTSMLIGRPVLKETINDALMNLENAGLPCKVIPETGIPYVEGKHIAARGNFGERKRGPDSTKALRMTPRELIRDTALGLLWMNVVDTTSRAKINVPLKGIGVRVWEEEEFAWVNLLIGDKYDRFYPDHGLILGERLASAKTLTPRGTPHIGKEEKRLMRKSIDARTYSVPVARIDLADVQLDIKDSGLSPAGFVRQAVNTNQPSIRKASLGRIGPIPVIPYT